MNTTCNRKMMPAERFRKESRSMSADFIRFLILMHVGALLFFGSFLLGSAGTIPKWATTAIVDITPLAFAIPAVMSWRRFTEHLT